MSTTFTCAQCGLDFPVPVQMVNVSFSGSGRNIVMPCPRCGSTEDLAPGNGTYSTGIDGRLVKVADYVARQTPAELLALSKRVSAIEAREDSLAAELELRSAGWTPPKGVPPREVRRQALQDVKLVSDVLNSVMDLILKGTITAGIVIAAFERFR